MSVTWRNAEQRAEAEPREASAPNGACAPERPRLVVTDRFDLLMVDMNITGARMHVKPVARIDAQALVKRLQPPIYSSKEYELSQLENELQTSIPRPQLGLGTQLLVMQRAGYREYRWFLVTYEADGDGVVE